MISTFTQPPDFILSLFSGYRGHIREYELFCMSMMLAICSTLPCRLILWHKSYKKIIFSVRADAVKWKIIVFMILIIPILLEMILAFTGLGGGGKGDLRKLIILLFGWRGGVLTNIFFLTFLIFIIMGFIKNVRRT